MPQSPPPDELEAMTVRMLRYLDRDCPAEEVQLLRDALTGSAVYRALFVQICRMHGELHEAYAPQRADRQRKAAPAARAAVAVGESPLPQLPTDEDRAARPELPQEPSQPGAADAGAETDIRQLSGEDTHFPKDKPLDK
jgi:hypothetical protein